MKGFPHVSVIMPAYNADKTIASAIESVLNQTFQEWELVVVNDGSWDSTDDIVKSYSAIDQRIGLLNLTKNLGLPKARNAGIASAKGEFIAFLDSDDLWFPEKLEVQLDFHVRNPEIKISHTNFVAFNKKGSVSRPMKRLLEPQMGKRGNIYPQICYKNPIGILTVMASSEVFKNVGMFDESLWTMEDQDLWVRIAKVGFEFGFIDKVLAKYRISETGITAKVGKYKRAHKIFINKLISSHEVKKPLLYRQYYRHFGTVYFRRKLYLMARLYFVKALRVRLLDITGLSTLAYLIYSELSFLRSKLSIRI